MDKRYSVFVSSTHTDLISERAAIAQALLELDCFPAGMELFPASDDDQWTLIARAIDLSDYYLLVLAGRYGTLTAEGNSYVEKEYDYARKNGIPVLSFIHKEPAKISMEHSEDKPDARRKLAAFRGKAQLDKHVKYWRSPEELKGQVLSSLVSAFKTHPRVGWVRGDKAIDVDLLRELTDLRKELATVRDRDQGNVAPSNVIEHIAHGQDKYVAKGFAEHGNFSFDRTRSEWSVELPWDDLFRYLGPIFDGPISRERALSEMGVLYGLSKDKKKTATDLHSRDLYLNYAQQILYQFQALGLIAKNNTGLWMLTRPGEQRLAEALAVKRPNGSS